MNNPLFLTLAQFLDEFKRRDDEIKHHPNGVRPFCWIIGSGASSQSHIPMGRTLVDRWLEEMFEASSSPSGNQETIQEWSKKKFEYIKGFDFDCAADFFPYIFRERFKNDPRAGRREIDQILENADPSFGYSVLAYLMAQGVHRVAVSTYFDDLVFESVALYTGTIPLSCGYETVMDYVNPAFCQKPLIAKPQRDLMVFPKIGLNEIKMLPEEWKAPLASIFEHYTPIVIGYGDFGYSGGNLMSFLQELQEKNGNHTSAKKNGIYWCYREDPAFVNVKPNDHVQEVVESMGGHLVPIVGFDELMLQLWDTLKLTSMARDMKQRSDWRVRIYEDQFKKLSRSTATLKGNSVTFATTRNSAESALKTWDQDAAWE